jgi:lysophospholipase L1-like esterase
VNDAIHAAAAEHGIPVARAYEAMNGSHGRIDGVGAGWVSSDQLHLSLEGAERVAELIAELGFEPAPS